MSDLIVISKESTKTWVRKFFPGFDFSKPLTSKDWQSLRGIIKKKEFAEQFSERSEQKKIKNRLAEITKKGITVGAWVRDDKGEGRKVRTITSNGYLILQGQPGTWHPCAWEKIG